MFTFESNVQLSMGVHIVNHTCSIAVVQSIRESYTSSEDNHVDVS